MIRRTFAPLALAVVAIALALALGSTPASAAQFNFTVDLDVAQATTAQPGASGSGTAAVSLDDSTNLLTWDLTFKGLADGPQSAIAAHFHKGAVGVAGGIEVDISVGALKSPSAGSATITNLQKADLNAGLWYINVHSTHSAGGEIRGQVPANANVGGVAELPEVAGAPLQATGSSDSNAGLIAGLIAAVVAGAVALGGAAWYVRRRPA